ncbi:SURF1 family protein [Roseomonas sp. BN140053]|uniref:SURF1 family protein n=1 Tax=Roseomonas sp. BN140053 TaxID=3391898 RepID=UPI0039EAA8DE
MTDATVPAARWRRLLLPLLAALPVLAILCWLGNWQVQRMHWKHALLAQIAAAEANPPIPLRDPATPFTKVRVSGRFLHDREVLLGAEVRGPALGARLVTPLQREDGRILLVDRGWVPIQRDRPVSRPEGVVEVTGWVRPADERSSVSAADDPAGRRFFTFDPPAIAAALQLPAPEPYALVALAPAATPAAATPPRPAVAGTTGAGAPAPVVAGSTGPAPGTAAPAGTPAPGAATSAPNAAAPDAAAGPPAAPGSVTTAPLAPGGLGAPRRAPAAVPAELPEPATELPRPTDPHLGYAITWYGLALSLVGVFAAFARRRLKDPA